MINQDLNNNICVNFKSFGVCPDNECKLQHIDIPKSQPEKKKLVLKNKVFVPSVVTQTKTSQVIEHEVMPVHAFTKPGILHDSPICACCNDMPMNCTGPQCLILGMCICINDLHYHDDDEERDDHQDLDLENLFMTEQMDCECCKGYVYNCTGAFCHDCCECYLTKLKS